MQYLPYSSQLPWNASWREDQRFRKILTTILVVSLILGLAIPFISVPEIERKKAQIDRERFAKLIIDRKKVVVKPKGPTPEELERRRKAEEERRKKLEEERRKREEERKKRLEELRKKREEEERRRRLEEERRKKLQEQQRKKQLEEQRRREQERQKRLEEERRRKQAEEQRRREQAEQRRREEERRRAEEARRRAEEERRRREEAARRERERIEREKAAGAAAAQDIFGELSDLSGSVPSAVTSSSAPLVSGAQTSAAEPRRRDVISSSTKRATAGSGGVDTRSLDDLGVGTGGVQLASRDTTQVGAVQTLVFDDAGSITSGTGGGGSSKSRARSERELNEVFERAKGQFYRARARAARKDPTISGKVVVRLTIAPSGQVTNVEIVSSDIADRSFQARIKAIVKSLRFPAKSVATVIVTYPLDFTQ